MFLSFLEGEASTNNNQWVSYALIGVLVVILVVSMILMNRRSKKREQEAQAIIDAVKPGNKVKTIGGVCGIVVEVNAEEDTFVLETGSEATGKCFMKFVRQAILESDAVVDKNAKATAPEASEPAAADPAEVSSPETHAETASPEVPVADGENKE